MAHSDSDTISTLYEAFSHLTAVRAPLPADESAYWSMPRATNQWRLPRDTKDASNSERLLLLPMRSRWYKPNAYLAVIPQPIVLHRAVGIVLEDYARRLFEHYEIEDSLARREFGVPMLIGRFDVIVDKTGHIQICELDDVCSLWPALPQLNPIAASYLRELERQLGMPIYTAELFQYSDGPQQASPKLRKAFARITFADGPDGEQRIAYIPRTDSFEFYVLDQEGLKHARSQKVGARTKGFYKDLAIRHYLHNEDHWRGDILEAWLNKKEQRDLDEVALSIRAFRDAQGFSEHLDYYGRRSITMAWNRDSKWPLVAERLAVLAPNLKTAFAFAAQWQTDHPSDLSVFKALHGARTEHTAIFSKRGTKQKGTSSASQIMRKFGKAAEGPIVVQPYKECDSLRAAGITFIGSLEDNNMRPETYTDRNVIRSVQHLGSQIPGESVLAGCEDRFAMLFRSFVVYLPQEKRLIHIGGMWQATDGRIVHGGSHSVAGPLYVQELGPHKAQKRTAAIRQAELLLQQYGRSN